MAAAMEAAEMATMGLATMVSLHQLCFEDANLSKVAYKLN